MTRGRWSRRFRPCTGAIPPTSMSLPTPLRNVPRALGLPIELHRAEIYLSIPGEASVEIAGKRYRAKPPALSLPVPGGRTAEAVYVRANMKNLRTYSKDVRAVFAAEGLDPDTLAARIAGRILVTEGFGNPALTALVQDMGAAGLVVINPGENIHWGTSSTIWGSPGLADLDRAPAIPVVAVNRADGAAIRDAVARGEPLSITSALTEGWFAQSVPVIEIPAGHPDAAEDPDAFVLVHGHYDSWEVGVGDNATGDATLLALAAALWKNRAQLRRSVRVAWWPGHSTGRYSGSTWYADRFALDLARNCVATVNCDSPGCRWASTYRKLTCMTEMQGFVADAVRDATGKTPEFLRPKRAGDASFLNLGITSYYSLSSTMSQELLDEKNYYEVSGCGGNIAWHTEDDVMEIADRAQFEADIALYTLSVLRHASARIVPGDWRLTVAEFRGILGSYHKAAGGAGDWRAAEAATDALDAALADLAQGVAQGAVAPARANRAHRELARLLVPLNFARLGRFEQDPAFACPALPGLAIASEAAPDAPRARNAAIDLQRGLNTYTAALSDALARVSAALAN